VTLVAFVVAALLALVLLVLAQRHLLRISRRVLNVPMVAGTVMLVILLLWSVIGLLSEQSALARAQRNGSDPVEVLSAMRFLASRAESDESLTLVARGGDAQPPADFAAVTAALSGGLLAESRSLAERTATLASADELQRALAAYQAQHARIDALVRAGGILPAIKIAVGSARRASAPSDRLTADLDRGIAGAQARFASASGDATSSLSGLQVAIPVLSIVIAALALLGLRQRIREYR
jgi:hypothetical protein